ncbi:MAG: Maf family protein, partial [Rickettsia endosymbiont of Ixodes ricinus]|nr:Maf family protein [Rickettsia endosymbiont of Ixodes ricinus]
SNGLCCRRILILGERSSTCCRCVSYLIGTLTPAQISGYAEAFISFISGSYSNVMGLPLFETVNALTSLGFKVHNTPK